MISWNTFGNRTVPALIAVFLALNPFPHVTALQAISFNLALFLLVVLILSRSAEFTFRTPFTWILAVYLGWSFASIFWSHDRANSLHDVYTHLLNYVVLFYILVNVFNTEKRFILLVKTIVISTAVFSIAAIAYFYFAGGNPLSARFLPDREIQPNMIGIITSFATVLSLSLLSREKKPPAIIMVSACFAASLAAMMLTYSRGALVALIVSLMLFFSQSWKKLLLVMLAGTIIVSFMIILSPEFRARAVPERMLQDGRIKIFYTALEIVKEHPLTGIGFGMETFRKEWTAYNSRLPQELRSKAFSHTHNFILDVLVRLGLVGLIIFFCIIGISLKTSWSLWRSGRSGFIRDWSHYSLCALVVLLVAGMTGNIMNNHKSAVLFYVCLAFASILHSLDSSAGKESSAMTAAGGKDVRQTIE
jgi:O-antigen ligase